jgi:hypothetical protein
MSSRSFVDGPRILARPLRGGFVVHAQVRGPVVVPGDDQAGSIS